MIDLLREALLHYHAHLMNEAARAATPAERAAHAAKALKCQLAATRTLPAVAAISAHFRDMRATDVADQYSPPTYVTDILIESLA